MSEWSEAMGKDLLCPFRETGLKSVVYRWIYWLAMTRVPLGGYGEAFPFFAERFPFGSEHQIDGRSRWITEYMSDKNRGWCRNYLNELRKDGEIGIKTKPDPFKPFTDDESFVTRRGQFVHAMVTHNYAVRGEARRAPSPHEEEKEETRRSRSRSGFARLVAERPDARLSDFEEDRAVTTMPSPVPMGDHPPPVLSPVPVRPRGPAARVPVLPPRRSPIQLRQRPAAPFKAPDPHLAEPGHVPPARPEPTPPGTSNIGPILALGAFFMLLAFLTDESN